MPHVSIVKDGIQAGKVGGNVSLRQHLFLIASGGVAQHLVGHTYLTSVDPRDGHEWDAQAVSQSIPQCALKRNALRLQCTL